MWWIRSSLLTLLLCLGIVWLMAAAQQPAQPAKGPNPAPPAAPPKLDPNAKAILDEAIQALDRNRLAWIETTIFQQMDVQGVLFRAEGLYLAGPERRLHLNLKVHLGESVGKMKVVCDGKTVWEEMQLGATDKRAVTKVDLALVDETLQRDKITPAVVDEYLQNMCFAGVNPLLKSLGKTMVPTAREKVNWNGQDAIKLTAVWSPELARNITQADKQPWPAFVPKHCRLYLDEKTRWPLRIEWWGPSPPRSGDALLLQLEFRNPKFVAMSEERCARVFRYDAGDAEVHDRTDRTIKELTARGSHLK